jgi:pseudouridine-5'-phosphate glycosidase
MAIYSPEVRKALDSGRPIVALESTIISHGLPRPTNLEVARDVEAIVRSAGATPATIAMIDGDVHIGLTNEYLERIAQGSDIHKATTRDLAIFAAQKKSAATTVAATAHLAHQAGISFFATGGLGGVHKGAQETWDESADLTALSRIPVTIVCAGAKSILDIGATLERLETLSVAIVGYKTNSFPGFYLKNSGFSIEHRCESPEEIAALLRARKDLGTDNSALIVAQPVDKEMDHALHASLLKSGLAAASQRHITGKSVTPFLLEYFHTESKGESLRVNIDIIKSNSHLAAQIAVAAHL